MLNDDFSLYVVAKEGGADARSACELAGLNGLDNLAKIRMLIHVFGLTIGEAKEVTILKYSSSLVEYQEKLVPALELAAELGLFKDVVTDKDIEEQNRTINALEAAGLKPVKSKKPSDGWSDEN